MARALKRMYHAPMGHGGHGSYHLGPFPWLRRWIPSYHPIPSHTIPYHRVPSRTMPPGVSRSDARTQVSVRYSKSTHGRVEAAFLLDPVGDACRASPLFSCSLRSMLGSIAIRGWDKM